MIKVEDRFLKYVSYDTQSDDQSDTTPSTDKQWELLRELYKELTELGIQASIDEHGCVMGRIPSNTDKDISKLGFIAHVDTSPALSGKDVTPRIIENYDGGDIVLNKELGIIMSPNDFETLENYVGDDLIVTDGTTLLGADDKAGVAEIMAIAETLLNHPEIIHGEIMIAFTPDEEIGGGVKYFDVKEFGADIAYTVDGEFVGEINYETFNAAEAKIEFTGLGIHTGSAKNKMINASKLAVEFDSMIPSHEVPETTEGYEGFYHLSSITGDVEKCDSTYYLRDHDKENFKKRKERLRKIARYLNDKYKENSVNIRFKEQYPNMREVIEQNFSVVENAVKACEELGIKPRITPIRGGTDGSNLSFMGLPCPNIGTGGHNFHGRYEYISVQSMRKVVEWIIKIIEIYARQEK